MALRHAESLIHQNLIRRSEVPVSLLCDMKMLNKVAWVGQSRIAPPFKSDAQSAEPSVKSSRRFFEKPLDPSRSYAHARTILDDINDNVPFSKSESIEEAVMDDVFNMDETMVDQAKPQSNAASASAAGTPEKEDDDVFDPASNATFTASVDQAPQANYTADNVINAANAFRPEGGGFKNRLRDQYASSNPEVPFEEDPFWQKVYSQLVDFDEAKTQLAIDSLAKQKKLAEESLGQKRQQRLVAEREELQERSERARIELSFEEAIERAFQARARAYEAWEKQCLAIRMDCVRAEQEAQLGFEELEQDSARLAADYTRHLQRKEEYRAAKIMHELRRHLVLSVRSGEDGQKSFERVVSIMADGGLTLRDLEFSDIKKKSLFMRLLEKDTAGIEDVVQREHYTEDMLTKFLNASVEKGHSVKVENPVNLVEKLLVAASSGGQFEAQKNLEQVFHLMKGNGISVKDVDLSCITKYSVFVRLLNWEAEQIPSIEDRERFTAGVLEDYVAKSIGGDHKAQPTKKRGL